MDGVKPSKRCTDKRVDISLPSFCTNISCDSGKLLSIVIIIIKFVLIDLVLTWVVLVDIKREIGKEKIQN